MAQKVTSIVEFSYRGTMNGQEYTGTAKSTENWLWTGGPVNEGVLLSWHREVWVDRMKSDNGVTVHPNSIKVLSTKFLT